MSKKFKSQASSARAANANFGSTAFGFGGSGTQTSSYISYVSEQPSLTDVSDPNVVVSLRNLGKKDSTTKAKALEELQEYVRLQGTTVEDSILNAWIELYPRTSIDNSRRVRQLAHTIQGSLTSSIGKRIASRLPKVIGCWLCGLYDNDRSVSRAATDALSLAFNSEEKRQSLWRFYRDSLLQYAEDAILVQTSGTLSDERSTTKEDADSKYARVIGSAMYMLCQLIKQNEHDSKKPLRDNDSIGQILAHKRLWELVHHDDPYVRRSACSLAIVCVEAGLVRGWAPISTAFVSKGLQTSQLGSAVQFSKALVVLTKARPEIWTSDYSAKTTASKRALEYLKRGSQRGTEEVWTNFLSLFQLIPDQVFAGSDGSCSLPEATAISNALLEGVTSSEEPRQNLNTAWSCYVEVCFNIYSRLGQPVDCEAFYEQQLQSLVLQYATLSISAPPATALSLTQRIALHSLEIDQVTAFEKLWSELEKVLDNKMRLSLPETSKEFTSSQEEVVKISDRVFKLARSIVESLSPTPKGTMRPLPAADRALLILDQLGRHIIAAAISILETRNGKPFGAAAVLQDAASVSKFADANEEPLQSFLKEDAPELMGSPSAERLVWLAASLKLPLGPLLRPLIDREDLNDPGTRALIAILSTISQQETESLPEVSSLILDTLNSRIASPSSPSIISAILRNSNLSSSDIVSQSVDTIVKVLSPESERATIHSALDLLQAGLSDPVSAANLTSEEHRNQVLEKLLLLSELEDHEISELATSVSAKLQTQSNKSGGGSSATLSIIVQQLAGAQPQLSIISLVELAVAEFRAVQTKKQVAAELLPTLGTWSKALEPHLLDQRPVSLGVTSPLQGAVFVLSGQPNNLPAGSYDSDGLSQAFRLSLYITRLVSETDILDALDDPSQQQLLHQYAIAMQLIKEKVTLDAANTLWIEVTGELIDEAAELLSQGTSIIQARLENGSVSSQNFLSDTWASVKGTSIKSYLAALSLVDVASRQFDPDRLAQIFPNLDAEIKQLHRSSDVLRAATLAYSTRELILSSASGRRILNELISIVTELKPSEPMSASLQPLIILNIVLNGDSETLEGIQSQRLVFLMQNLVRLFELSTEMTCEVFKLLTALLPALRDIYGDHWQAIFEKIRQTWESLEDLDHDLPLLHSSLRLYQKLKGLAIGDEANEDLFDAWTDARPSLNADLVHCLLPFETLSVGVNQPRQITAGLLGRLLRTVEVEPEDIAATIALLGVRDDAVISAAYNLLHRAIPKRQEDLSMELVLNKTVTHLPEDLLSLLSEDAASPSSPSFKRYLLCWKLVFDHFPTASYKLRETYTTDLKEAGQIAGLIDSICNIIRITSGRPLDVSKWNIENFGLVEQDSHEIQELSVHLYYCALLHVPGLVKAWFIEQKNRIRSPLESWTQKYISPSMVSASMESVTEWAKTQDQDDTPLEIKTNPKSRELIASMAIDPESPPTSIAVVLPSSFPLESPNVVGRTRVGVSEKNWSAWIRTFQIIIFSTGSIIDGLIAFRRNTQGALKGQGECAICYSIIGPDMRTPSKKCMTCKNAFHSVCLLRWFQNSNSSSCPLCRNNFNYG